MAEKAGYGKIWTTWNVFQTFHPGNSHFFIGNWGSPMQASKTMGEERWREEFIKLQLINNFCLRNEECWYLQRIFQVRSYTVAQWVFKRLAKCLSILSSKKLTGIEYSALHNMEYCFMSELFSPFRLSVFTQIYQ